MKTYRYIAILLAGVAAVSCQKELRDSMPAPESGQEYVTITAGIPESTKVGANVGFSWYWSEGDRLAVTGSGDPQIFTIKSGFSSKLAEFTGKPVKGDSFTIQYPADAAINWNSQTQNGNDSYAHLQYAASLQGVDDYLNFVFSPGWAEAHGGTLRQSGVLKVTATVPEDVTSVTGLTISADSPIFYSGNDDTMTKKLELSMSNVVPDANHTIVAWMSTSWNEATVPAGTILTVTINTTGVALSTDVTFTKESVIKSGKVNTFVVNASGWVAPSRYGSGSGTSSDPWVIVNAEQLLNMRDDLVSGDIRYFKLGADIDMTGVTWTPLNATSPYDKQIDFDGDNYTISNFTISGGSNSSFFGVLCGNCRNVNFTNASVTATGAGYGILGGYGGYGSMACTVSRVDVQGTVTSASSSNGGGLFGIGVGTVINQCSADVVMNCNGKNIGGIIGIDNTSPVTIRNCCTSGSIVSTASICGGIAAEFVVAKSSVYNCWSSMSITTQFIFGGIVGRAVLGKKSNATNCQNENPENHVEKCIAWNPLLKSNTSETTEHYSSGAIVGATATRNYLKGCIRRPDLDFQLCQYNTSCGYYSLRDQDDIDPDNPLVKNDGTYPFYYHGKAAAVGQTLSQVAQSLDWSAEIWDFDGDTPKLK